jgi:hypothetical protein
MYVLECKPMLVKDQPRAQYMQDPRLCACRRLSIPELKLGGEVRENLEIQRRVPGAQNVKVIKPQRL